MEACRFDDAFDDLIRDHNFGTDLIVDSWHPPGRRFNSCSSLLQVVIPMLSQEARGQRYTARSCRLQRFSLSL